MELKKFKQIDLLLGIAVSIVAACTYLLTIEPTVSFWDCGEFIASSYKLEVGHAPGNPTFQIIARVFTLFGNKEHAAMWVNIMSALCSAATILFLFWSITHLGRRIIERNKEALSIGNAIAVLCAGAVGALAYTFSDTFWFSAVEGEVYAMSSLFTAAVFWAMLKWEEVADKAYANRWIVLIAYLMGLSIGVHLLNLLTIPALVFIYYYKKYPFSRKGAIYTFILAVVILAVVLYGIIPWTPKIASWFDLLFVNVLGLGFNSGVAFFMALLLAACFWSVYYTYKKGKVLWNTILLCVTMILIGYSSFAVVIIRSSVNTPTNEGQPDNPFSLMRYLGREQYGDNPLIYGHAFTSPYTAKTPYYYAKTDKTYKRIPGSIKAEYADNAKMLFPRMWSSVDAHENFYESYTRGRGKAIEGSSNKMPFFKDNLAYFFDYQINWMYIRYFMWNFAGRQNDFHCTLPGDPLRGNWESGIGAIDRWRLGDQRNGPDYIVHNNAKNHFYFLPLILGILGLFYQYARDRRNTWIVFLLFFLTGLAIVVYLNQPPHQPRERDYAYAGSFYAFAIWIGLGAMSVYEFLRKRKMGQVASASVAGAVCLMVPIQMASQTWDDHDRSHRYTARDMAYNYLMTCGPQGILVTVGDNDTFPLWYIQEVEGVRTDVRILNTSLLGTDWYIDQMKYQMYESQPLPFSIPKELYAGGANDYLYIDELVDKPVTLKAAMGFVANPKARRVLSGGELVSTMPARKLLIPVNRKNVEKYGIVSPKQMDKVLDTLVISLPSGKSALSKPEMMVLNLLANYEWDRPIHFTALGGDLKIDLAKYMQFDGFAYRLVPFVCANRTTSPTVDADWMYEQIMHVWRWDCFANPKMHVDYHNLLTFEVLVPLRSIFTNTADALWDEGQKEKAIAVLDKMQEVVPPAFFPLHSILVLASLHSPSAVLKAAEIYAAAGEDQKAVTLCEAFAEEVLATLNLLGNSLAYYSEDEIQNNLYFLFNATEIIAKFDKEKAAGYEKRFREWAGNLME